MTWIDLMIDLVIDLFVWCADRGKTSFAECAGF
jgi:hypothetical protein